MKFIIYMIASIMMFFSFLSCSSDSSDPKKIISHDVTVTKSPLVRRLGIAEQINTKISLGEEPKDVYLLLSNYANEKGSIHISNSVQHSAKMDTAPIAVNDKVIIEDVTPTIIHAPDEVELFRKDIRLYLKQKIALINKNLSISKLQKDALGDNKLFYLDEYGRNTTMATARKVLSISTNHGIKQLNIWVSNDSFDATCTKVKCLTQTMVDALANSFLKEGLDNDVYDWVSNIFGAEWGENNHSNVIANNNDITILLTDIDNDNSTKGGVLGYFYPKDNFNKEVIPGSNERIMLYADSLLFANGNGNGNGSWSVNDFWFKEMISTLAHELQHLIHFYQKNILRTEETTDTWINEMLSESTEDLIASKIGHTGSRGVDCSVGGAGESNNSLGRYPLFNAKNNNSLTQWFNRVENYAVVNAFGAFLLRNYGGAKVLHDIVHNNLVDEKAIVYTVQQTPRGQGKTFDDLLREWGVAVLLSDNDNLGEEFPHYNSGGYIPNQYNLSTYSLGSVNFFNYNPTPQFHGDFGTIQGQGNYYYRVGSGLTGDVNINVKLNGKTEATLIVK